MIFYSELYGRLIHCLADGRNKRKIKLPPSETIQSRINSGEFTSPSETAAAAFSVEDACRHFDGLEVNVGVKGGRRRKTRMAQGESGCKELRGSVLQAAAVLIAFPVCFPALHKGFLYIQLRRSDTSFTDYLAVHTIFPEERLSDKLASNLKMDGDKEVEPCSLLQRTVEG